MLFPHSAGVDARLTKRFRDGGHLFVDLLLIIRDRHLLGLNFFREGDHLLLVAIRRRVRRERSDAQDKEGHGS